MKNKVDFIIKINQSLDAKEFERIEKHISDKYDNVLVMYDPGEKIEVESIKLKGVREVDDVNDII